MVLSTLSSITTFVLLIAYLSEAKVEILRTDTFDVATREGFWLVDFYAPWCGHCKKLNPILDEIVDEAGEKGMKIGKVDATSEKKLSDDFDVQGFPTLKFRVHAGEKWRTYEGMRKGVNMLEFADRMLSDALPIINTEEDVNKLIEKSNETGNGVVFLFGSDPEDESWPANALSMAQSVQHKTYSGILAPSVSLSWDGMDSSGILQRTVFPQGKFIASVEKGEIPRFAPADTLNNQEMVEGWILSNNAPVYSVLASSNFRKLGKLGKLLVIAIVDPSNETTPTYLEGFQNVARSIQAEKQTVLEVSKGAISDHYVFGSLDGVHWAEFIEQFNIYGNELPRLVVLDMPKEVFYEDPEVDEVDEMDTFLHQVFEGKIQAQKEGMRGTVNRFFSKVNALGWRFYLLAIPFVIAIVGSFLVPTTPPPRKRDRKVD